MKIRDCISGGSEAYSGSTWRSGQSAADMAATRALSCRTTLSISSWPVRNSRMSPGMGLPVWISITVFRQVSTWFGGGSSGSSACASVTGNIRPGTLKTGQSKKYELRAQAVRVAGAVRRQRRQHLRRVALAPRPARLPRA